MPVALPVGDHAAFLWMAFATHALVGYALGAILFDEPRWGLLGGVAADADLLLPLAWQPPLVHRGITHTALAVLVVALLVAAWRRSAGVAAAAGYASHLTIDATTAAGVPLFYPFSTAHVGVALGGHDPLPTGLLWVAGLAALYWRRR